MDWQFFILESEKLEYMLFFLCYFNLLAPKFYI